MNGVGAGREAFARRAWGESRAQLAGAAADAEDLERLAVAAHLVGRDEESAQAWAGAHADWVRRDRPDRAGRCAFWLAITLMLRGEVAQAGGWLARAERLAEQSPDGAARGYILVPAFLDALDEGRTSEAHALAERVVEVAEEVGDQDLRAFGTLISGQAALASGEARRGMTLLDEVMVSVASTETSPIAVGIVYCAVIEACMDAFDVRRAAEWTDVLHRWCAGQPDLVPYRGQCLVHRSQILQARGAWDEAAAEAARACRLLGDRRHPALGLALYQTGELLRLRGELAAAEQAYRSAGEHGREPAPGLALLRLAQGRGRSAAATVRRMVAESRGRLDHAPMLAAAVEVLIAEGDADGAARESGTLAEIAEALDTPLLMAVADYATGTVLLARRSAVAALTALRRACATWRELEMPYDAARACLQVALACRALGDADGAALELDAARATFERLGARPDLERMGALLDPHAARPGSLTSRECEVLRLVAAGLTDREIAAVLVISEHTVGRHLQNMFAKLGVASRAAATAFAYEHGLV